MAGGIFHAATPKVRPGSYVNIISKNQQAASNAMSGIAMIPLIGYDWGPREEWIHLTAESPEEQKAKLGRSIYEENEHMRLLRLLFLNAEEVYVYIPAGGEKAQGTIPVESGTMEVSTKYTGTLGNEIKVASAANPLGGFDVSVFLNGSEAERFEGVVSTSDLMDSSYIELEGEGVLKEFAAVSLSGGTDDPEQLNASVSKFLDMSEKSALTAWHSPRKMRH